MVYGRFADAATPVEFVCSCSRGASRSMSRACRGARNDAKLSTGDCRAALAITLFFLILQEKCKLIQVISSTAVLLCTIEGLETEFNASGKCQHMRQLTVHRALGRTGGRAGARCCPDAALVVECRSPRYIHAAHSGSGVSRHSAIAPWQPEAEGRDRNEGRRRL